MLNRFEINKHARVRTCKIYGYINCKMENHKQIAIRIFEIFPMMWLLYTFLCLHISWQFCVYTFVALMHLLHQKWNRIEIGCEIEFILLHLLAVFIIFFGQSIIRVRRLSHLRHVNSLKNWLHIETIIIMIQIYIHTCNIPYKRNT